MSTSIPELIADELVTRLETITSGNGYPFSVPSVDRIIRGARDWRPRNLGLAVEQAIEARNQALDHEGNPAAIGYSLAFNIHAFVRQSDNNTATPDQTTENALVAAIKKAVAGTSDWHQFNDNAIDADWSATRPFTTSEGDHCGVTLTLTVHYRISETDPYTSRA